MKSRTSNRTIYIVAETIQQFPKSLPFIIRNGTKINTKKDKSAQISQKQTIDRLFKRILLSTRKVTRLGVPRTAPEIVREKSFSKKLRDLFFH